MLRPWNVPPGLECLLQVNYLRIKNTLYDVQRTTEEVLGSVHHREHITKLFSIQNSAQQDLLFCRQEGKTDLAVLLRTVFLNSQQQEVMIMKGTDCCTNQADWGLGMVEVTLPGNEPIGYLRLENEFCQSLFYVENEEHDLVFCIDGRADPCCLPRCSDGTGKFPIFSRTRQTKVGHISKKTKPLDFETVFPIDLEVKMKAVLMAATLVAG